MLYSIPQNIVLSLEDRDADELVLVLTGYHRLLTRNAGLQQEELLNVVRQKSEFNAGREICEFTQPVPLNKERHCFHTLTVLSQNF